MFLIQAGIIGIIVSRKKKHLGQETLSQNIAESGYSTVGISSSNKKNKSIKDYGPGISSDGASSSYQVTHL
ncbi:hypothetical protein TNCT_444481 [Trichonephila clavata]|uniref:Uncharacterized protein n=1 Tax=Trichonephila clavata TaxID=2740835 RepID=A0A8X6JGP5_TRICU|nr:hypothetical protein TNCT_444481 [Trichonephila clavata]